MKNTLQAILSISILLIMGCASTIAQDEDHSSHMMGGGMEQLDAHLERIQNADNDGNRKRMLSHHIQLMKAQMDEMASMEHGGMMGGGMGGMNHGEGGMGGGMGGMNHGEGGMGDGMGGMNQAEGDMGGGMGGGMGGMNHGEGGMGGGMGGMNHGEGGMGDGMGGMNHGEGGMGGGMGGMMQHHNDVLKMMQHMLATQEMLLELIDD